MTTLTLYGPHWSAYTRTVRLILSEKALSYELVEVDFSTGTMPKEHLLRHPFAKVPVLDHGGYVIFETAAIGRYLNAAFGGASLEPAEPKLLGTMVQLIAIVDQYLSAQIRMGFINESVINPMVGLPVNQTVVVEAIKEIKKGFAVLADCQTGKFLAGDELSLADLHAAPLFDFLDSTEVGADLIDEQPSLRGWFDTIAERASMKSTAIDLGVFASKLAVSKNDNSNSDA